MASSLISNINSQSQLQANKLTNRPNRVKVMVEDELDVVIWHRILKMFAPHMQFDVHPYSFDTTANGKGKAQIIAHAAQFGKYFIGCVDSDHDWLLQKWTADGMTINSTRYIFQTYAYSIENLAAHPFGTADCMLECSLHSCDILHNLDNDLEKFLSRLSTSVYEVLIWHLTMKKENTDLSQISVGWNEIFGNGHYADIRNDRTLPIERKRAAILERFANRANGLAKQYAATYPQFKQTFENLRTTLNSDFGLSPDNAYLHVRGHNLHDFLIHNFFKPVEHIVRNLHRDEIRAHTNGAETQNAINHYKSLLKDFELDYIHRISYMYDISNPVASRIKQDITAVFNLS